MGRKKKEVLSDKEQLHIQVREQLQQFVDKHKFDLMSECMKSWNSKNTLKILEIIKMDNTFNLHMSDKSSIMIIDDNMRLG